MRWRPRRPAIPYVLRSKVDVMNDSQRTDLSGVPATLLMPLWARARETAHPRPILRDEKSVAMVESLDFDFGRFEQQRVPIADYCVRSRIVDQLVRAKLAARPEMTVVELGAGLDTRFDRLDNGRLRWMEFDLPEVIELRRRFFQTGGRRTMLAGSLLDADWCAAVAREVPRVDLFVAEGVFYFLSGAQVRTLLQQVADTFPGAAIVFDAQSPLFLWFSNWRQPIARARLRFALRCARDLETWDARFELEKYVGFGDAPYYDDVLHRLAWYKRLLGRAHPLTRRLFQIIQLKLSRESQEVL